MAKLLSALGWLGLIFFGVGCQDDRTPIDYEIPASYRGWVVTFYSQSQKPPLSEIDGRQVQNFNQHGFLETSTDPEFGGAQDHFFFVDQNRNRTPIQQKSGVDIHAHATGVGYAYFFVGTTADFSTAPDIEKHLETLQQVRGAQSDLSTPLD